MPRYRIPYNQHKYIDLSDPPRRAYRTISAPNREAAAEKIYTWRIRNQDGITTPRGNRYYIGIVFPESMEESA